MIWTVGLEPMTTVVCLSGEPSIAVCSLAGGSGAGRRAAVAADTDGGCWPKAPVAGWPLAATRSASAAWE